MDINELILTDAGVDAIEKGAWVGDLPGAPGVRLKVLGASSKVYIKALQARMELLRKKQDGAPLTHKQHDIVVNEVSAEVGLLDWEGLTKDGEQFPFDRKVAKQWLTSRGGEQFGNLVAYASHQLAKNANKYAEQATKN